MKAILIDDEPLALEYLERQINKISQIVVVNKFTYFDINQNKELLHEIDLIFLDIDMPETNGIQLAEQILEVNASLSIIFVTAYKYYAVEAFELDALDYII